MTVRSSADYADEEEEVECCAKDSFVPSRDLLDLQRVIRTQLRARGSSEHDSIIKVCEQVVRGLDRIARAFGVALDQSEKIVVRLVKEDQRSAKVQQEAPNEEAGNVDTFETQYARQWLSNVVCLRWFEVLLSSGAEMDGEEEAIVEAITAEASRLIAILAGQSASGNVQKVFCFPLQTSATTYANRSDTQVLIGEAAVVEDGLGGRTWGAAPLLAAYMLDRLAKEHASSSDRVNRVLELGAGTGLVGLAMSKWLRSAYSQDSEPVVHLTDYQKHVLVNLTRNARINKVSTEAACDVAVQTLDWRTLPANGQASHVGLCESYDCIVAADCVYEVEHAALLKRVTERFLVRPSEWETASGRRNPSHCAHNGKGRLFLLLTNRSSFAKEAQSIHDIFPTWNAGGEVQRCNAAEDSLALYITERLTIVSSQQDEFGPPQLCLDLARRSAKEVFATIIDDGRTISRFLLIAQVYHLYIIEWRGASASSK